MARMPTCADRAVSTAAGARCEKDRVIWSEPAVPAILDRINRMSRKQWGHGFHSGFNAAVVVCKTLENKRDNSITEKNIITIEQDANFNSRPVLICPRCGETYLHHGRVQTYHPTYDKQRGYEFGSYFSDNDGKGNEFSEFCSMKGNPSVNDRRGIRIDFECESCSENEKGMQLPLQLCIAQHKGQTLMWWEYVTT